MYKRILLVGLAAAFALGALCEVTVRAAELSDAIKKELATTKFVYVSSKRKDGTFGKPAEIWFLYHNGAVYVATPPTTWRVRRIKAGRPEAKIAVGTLNGPAFMATGAIVNEPEVHPLMFETFAKKYSDNWSNYADRFRNGLKDGSRVLIKYTPKPS